MSKILFLIAVCTVIGLTVIALGYVIGMLVK
jgi:hypothetical protein